MPILDQQSLIKFFPNSSWLSWGSSAFHAPKGALSFSYISFLALDPY